MDRLRPVLSLVLLAMGIAWGLWSIRPPGVAPAASGAEFSVEGALAHVQAMAQRPHPAGSAESRRVREYIVEAFRKAGLEVTVQQATQGGGLVLENILAKHKGSGTGGRAILLAAHSDSARAGPGASDDAAAVATLLETARALQAVSTKRDVNFLITDGEELGMQGAQEFVKANAEFLRQVDVVLNFEARGTAGPVLMFETGDGNSELVRAMRAVCPRPVATSFAQDVYKCLPNDTDFTIFKNVGKTGMNFAVIVGLDYYHTAQDDVEHLSRESLQHYGSYALPLAKFLGNADDEFFRGLGDKRGAVYFPAAPGWLAMYPQSWAVPLWVAAVVLLAGAMVAGFLRLQLRITGTLLCGMVVLAMAGLAGILGWLAMLAVAHWTHPAVYGVFFIRVPWAGTVMLALLAVSFGIALLWRWRLRGLVLNNETLAGTLLVWAVLAGVCTFYLPGASYLFLWPMAGGAGALAITVARGGERFSVSVERQIFTCIPAAVLFSPVLYLLYYTVTLGSAPVLMALVVLMTSLMDLGWRDIQPHPAHDAS